MLAKLKNVQVGDLLIIRDDVPDPDVYMYLGRYFHRDDYNDQGHIYFFISSLNWLGRHTNNFEHEAIIRYVDNQTFRLRGNLYAEGSFTKNPKRFKRLLGHVDIKELSAEFNKRMINPFNRVCLDVIDESKLKEIFNV